jgi:hypothetical protein
MFVFLDVQVKMCACTSEQVSCVYGTSLEFEIVNLRYRKHYVNKKSEKQ